MSLVPMRRSARQGALGMISLAAALSLSFAGNAQAEGPRIAPLSLRSPLSVGASTDSYPYSYVDASGRLTGFSVDLLDAVARAVNLRIERVEAPTAELQQRFLKGEFQMLQSHGVPFGPVPYAEFSVPILKFQSAVFVLKGGPVRTIADLNGRSFGAIEGFGISERFLADHHIKVVIVRCSSREEMLGKVSRGEVAGCLLSELSELAVSQEMGLKTIARIDGPYEDYEIRQAFAVHPGDAELLARLNEGLAIVHKSGEYDRLYRKHFNRFGSYIVTAREIGIYGSIFLLVALVFALAAYLRQSSLRRALSAQTQMLAQQGDLLKALYDNVPIAMTVVEKDAAGPRILSMNRQACGLYSVAAEAAGGLLADLPVSEEIREHLTVALERRPGPKDPASYETILKSGRRVVEVTTIKLASAEAPGSERVCILAEDVTDRKKQEAEIVRSRKLRAVGELVGGIAHEFNNLLTPVMLKAGEIQLTRPDDSVLQKDIEVIVQAVQRTAELTRRLLAFGRKAEHKPEIVQISEVAAGCFDLLRNTVDRRISWSNTIPGDLPPLFFNATDLYQILVNLLLNARDALTERLVGRYPSDWTPRISVEASQLPPAAFPPPQSAHGKVLVGWQMVSVSDNGLGMPAEVIERIFEPFFTTKDVGKGTGLGLATVWHLVNDAGGHVKVESTMGTGSTFRVYLPVWPPSEPAPTPPPKPATGATARILLAEDESLVALPLVQALGRRGHTVRYFENGLDAWRHLAADLAAYDLLIIDVNLPGMNGVDIVERARKGSFNGRILMISGRFTSSDMGALTRLGIDHSLTKPFYMETFLAAVQRCIGPARA